MSVMEAKSKGLHGGARPGAGRKAKIQDEALSIQKILDIIGVCKSTNIKSLKYGPLEVEFHESLPSPASTSSENDEEVKEEARLAQLMIDDPAGYEQEVIDSQRWSEHA